MAIFNSKPVPLKEQDPSVKPCRNAQWKRQFLEIPNFRKMGQPREVDQNF